MKRARNAERARNRQPMTVSGVRALNASAPRETRMLRTLEARVIAGTALHAVLLIALAATGWPPWSLLLLMWPVLGFCGARGDEPDNLGVYVVGCAALAAGHIGSLAVRFPAEQVRAMTGVCAAHELLMLAAGGLLVRRRRAARRGVAVAAAPPPSSRSSIVPL